MYTQGPRAHCQPELLTALNDFFVWCLWLCSVATLQAYMQACLKSGKRDCEGSNVSRSLGIAAEFAMQSF